MPHSTLKGFRFDNDADEIRGANVYGNHDEKLGDVDDVIFNHEDGSIRYVVVDTGGWLSSKKFLVPADQLQGRGDSNDFTVNLSQEQIERFPEYEESMFDSGEDDSRWNDYDRRYQASWTESGGVLHQEESTRIITPEPEPGSITGGGSRGTYQPDLTKRRVGKSPEPMTHVSTNQSQKAYANLKTDLGTEARSTGSLGQEQPFSGSQSGRSFQQGGDYEGGVRESKDLDALGDSPRLRQDRAERLDRFESRIRERRQDVVGHCRACGDEGRTPRVA